MKTRLFVLLSLLVSVSLLIPFAPGGVSPTVAQSQDDWQTTAWEDVASLPETMVPDGAVTLAGFTYVIDDTDVYYSVTGVPIGWLATNGPPTDADPGEIVSDGEYIWQLHGYWGEIFYTSWLMDGSLQTWQELPYEPPVGFGAEDVGFAAVRGYLFRIGGYGGMPYDPPYYYHNVLSSVQRIKINSDGSLGTDPPRLNWQSTADLPEGRGDVRVANWNEWLYVLGGFVCDDSAGYCQRGAYTSTVYYGHVESDGSIATWHSGPDLPDALSKFAVVTVDDALYVIGGMDNGDYSKKVYRAEIDPDGSLAEWVRVPHLRLPNGLAGHAAVFAGNHILTFGGHEPGGMRDKVRRAVPTYRIDEISDRLDSDPDGIVGRRIFVRAMPVATWDPTFGGAELLKFASFLHELKDVGEAVVCGISWATLGKAAAIHHLVHTFTDARVQVYYGVDLPCAGGAIAATDLPSGGIPQVGQPYVMHGTIASTTFINLEGEHTLYFFNLESSDDFWPDTPSPSNPRFPIQAGTTWRPLPMLVDSDAEGQEYATIGIISKRFSYGSSHVLVLSTRGSDEDTLYVVFPPYGKTFPEKGNVVLVTGTWTPLTIEDDGIYIRKVLSSTADDVRCLTDRLNGCFESVIAPGVDLSGLQDLVIEVGSPVDVHLYDGAGRHTGALYDGSGNPIGVENQIPNSYYFPGDSDDFEAIMVDELQGSDYEIRVRGTGTGSYSLGQMIVPTGRTQSFTTVVPSASTAAGQIDTYDVEGLPAPPSSITVTQIGPSQLVVSWTESPSVGIAGYNVYLIQGNSQTASLRRVNSSPVSGASFTIESVSPGTDYQVGVTAVSPSWIESGFEQWIPIHTKGYTSLPVVLRNYTPGSQPTPSNHPPHPPSNPSPPDGATDQSVAADLSWTGGDPDGDSVTYDVYLEANDSSPDELVCNDVSSTACEPGTLNNGTHYYWQVVARDAHGTTATGPVWDFTTEAGGPGPGEMVTVPAGEFQMGCDEGNPNESCISDAQPLHTVYLDAYAIDKHEVTNAQYAEFLNAEGNQEEGGATWLDADDDDVRIHQNGVWQADAGYEDHPVVEVSWYGARAYCQWQGKRLPTEAEWEKAARGDSDIRVYPWGDDAPDCLRLNYYHSGTGYCVGDTTQVGSYPSGASPYGALDMSGNVSEWVNDWFDSNYYSTYPVDGWPSNPSGPATGTYKVLRGGGWGSYWDNVRAAFRSYNIDGPHYSGDTMGFRCAGVAPGP
jgi:formylglycine-generating enzyme required for sulfatase activity